MIARCGRVAEIRNELRLGGGEMSKGEGLFDFDRLPLRIPAGERFGRPKRVR